jgi:crotonobetainyl-CoA:carnitine CoA-transferase CaiB-like acyl-CoA transferase
VLLEGTDMCFTTVLDLDEVTDHPHMKARGIFVMSNGKFNQALHLASAELKRGRRNRA